MTSGFLSKLQTKNISKKYYFMAGLPRSGSTLLSTILNQNPNFYSGPSSPVLSTMYVIEQHLLNDELFHGFPKQEQGKLIISKVIDHFYDDINQPIIIDKNRAWTARIPFIEHYIGQKAKIICPVRDIDEILTSMIMMIRRNPYKEGNPRINFIDEQLVKLNIPINDDNRCEYIGGSSGILGQSLNSIQEAIEQGFLDRIHFVEYKNLVSKPEETLNKIYNFLGEDYYQHTFDNLKNTNREDDMNTYGLQDMHEVRSKLEYKSLDPTKILSNYVLEKSKGMDIWRSSSSTKQVETISKYVKIQPNQIQIVN
jgi:sulfotransferase